MNEHRVIWQESHGPIPKDWLVHHLNGNKRDNRLENLACIPRHAANQGIVTAPYVIRVQQLERLLKQQKE